jgi:hypothetical protein
MAIPGSFAWCQPIYAAHRIATFPVVIEGDDKRPAVHHYARMGLRASRQLAERFRHAPIFGFMAGARSRKTLLDVDTSDERVVADMLDRHGKTPVIARTLRGRFHLYYRHNGEGRHLRPSEGLPVDLLGGGVVVAPPSQTQSGAYHFIQGGFDDLDDLPTIRNLHLLLGSANDNAGGLLKSEPTSHAERVAKGERKDALFRYCMQEAPTCASADELLTRATAYAATALSPIPSPVSDKQIRRAVMSAWGYEERGENFVGQGRNVVTGFDTVDRLALDPDASHLLTNIKRHHWGRDRFALSHAMAPKIGLSRERFLRARARLLDAEELVCVHPGGQGGNDPALYAWRSRRRR